MRLSHNISPLIMVAPNGARRGKNDHAALPITTQEIIAETRACAAAGAHALHLHIRDEAARHSLDPGRYRETLAELNRALPGFPVQITTESAGLFDVQTQLACLKDVQPKAASISVREMARDAELAAEAYDLCAQSDTLVQHILYDLDDWQQLLRWRKNGVIAESQGDIIFVFGRYAPARSAAPSELEKLAPIMDAAIGRVMVCAFGPQEHQVLCAAAALGCDLRVGFENNIHKPNGALAQSNAAQVARLLNDLPNIHPERSD